MFSSCPRGFSPCILAPKTCIWKLAVGGNVCLFLARSDELVTQMDVLDALCFSPLQALVKMIKGDILELCYLLFCCLPVLCLLILCGSNPDCFHHLRLFILQNKRVKWQFRKSTKQVYKSTPQYAQQFERKTLQVCQGNFILGHTVSFLLSYVSQSIIHPLAGCDTKNAKTSMNSSVVLFE